MQCNVALYKTDPTCTHIDLHTGAAAHCLKEGGAHGRKVTFHASALCCYKLPPPPSPTHTLHQCKHKQLSQPPKQHLLLPGCLQRSLHSPLSLTKIANMHNQAELALQQHNYYRSLHGAPPLALDGALCQHARNYANRGVFAHDQQAKTLGQGENLGIGYGSAAAAVDAFYSKSSQYDYRNPVFSKSTGHFTQLVWKGTQSLGVGIGRTAGGQPLYVFRYWPQGNVTGHFAANVTPPVSARQMCCL